MQRIASGALSYVLSCSGSGTSVVVYIQKAPNLQEENLKLSYTAGARTARNQWGRPDFGAGGDPIGAKAAKANGT